MNIKLSDSELRELKKLLSSPILKNFKDIDLTILDNLNERLNPQINISLYVDGAADVHSNRAGIGGIIYKGSQEIFTFSEYIGKATNNEAEYRALIRGLKEIINLKILSVDIYADSELVVKQINGKYKVKNERMLALHAKVMEIINELNKWTITHIPREKNSIADKLSKEGMRNN